MSGSNDRVAGELIAQIRRTSGLTQAELARRSGLQSSVLSAYEHGRRQPSVSALARIARAAGLELEISPLADADALERSGEVLVQVLELADRMPSKQRGELAYPPLVGLAS
jgi:transcriptional regulator with XRE-family HTH domain